MQVLLMVSQPRDAVRNRFVQAGPTYRRHHRRVVFAVMAAALVWGCGSAQQIGGSGGAPVRPILVEFDATFVERYAGRDLAITADGAFADGLTLDASIEIYPAAVPAGTEHISFLLDGDDRADSSRIDPFRPDTVLYYRFSPERDPFTEGVARVETITDERSNEILSSHAVRGQPSELDDSENG